jgi:hypothetical protein
MQAEAKAVQLRAAEPWFCPQIQKECREDCASYVDVEVVGNPYLANKPTDEWDVVPAYCTHCDVNMKRPDNPFSMKLGNVYGSASYMDTATAYSQSVGRAMRSQTVLGGAAEAKDQADLLTKLGIADNPVGGDSDGS